MKVIQQIMLFNPFTGQPRDPRDIQSDPYGQLIWDGETPLHPAARAEQDMTVKQAWWAGYRTGKGLPADTPRQDAPAPDTADNGPCCDGSGLVFAGSGKLPPAKCRYCSDMWGKRYRNLPHLMLLWKTGSMSSNDVCVELFRHFSSEPSVAAEEDDDGPQT